MLRQKSLKLYRDFLKTIKTIPLEQDRQQFISWVKDDFKKNKFETDEVWFKFVASSLNFNNMQNTIKLLLSMF